MAPRLCGFAAVRCILVLLNSIYIGISLFLIGLVVAARTLAYNYTNIQILIGIGIVAGFLFLVAVLGLVGTLRHNQIIMFFYMILLGLSGISLFAVCVGALSIPRQFQRDIFSNVWQSFDNSKKSQVQDQLGCCGFDSDTQNFLSYGNSSCDAGHPFCNTTILKNGCCWNYNASAKVTIINNRTFICSESSQICPDCNPCYSAWEESVSKGLKLAGGLGLIFSFTQIAGIVLSFRYRNLKDPSANPGSYL